MLCLYVIELKSGNHLLVYFWKYTWTETYLWWMEHIYAGYIYDENLDINQCCAKICLSVLWNIFSIEKEVSVLHIVVRMISYSFWISFGYVLCLLCYYIIILPLPVILCNFAVFLTFWKPHRNFFRIHYFVPKRNLYRLWECWLQMEIYGSHTWS